MNEYQSLLTELENELAEIKAIDISAKVEERLAAIRADVFQEELDAKRDAEDKKVAEIEALNRIIARLPVAEEVPVADTPVEEPVAVEETAEAEENVVEG